MCTAEPSTEFSIGSAVGYPAGCATAATHGTHSASSSMSSNRSFLGEIRMRLLITTALCCTIAHASAQSFTLSPTDTIQSVAAAQKGKRVTLRLRSGQELTGMLRDSTDRLVVLAELSGREFFDAAIPIGTIEAIIIRTKQ